MATSFSTPVGTAPPLPHSKQNPTKTIVSLRDTCFIGPRCARLNSTSHNVVTWRSAANYVAIDGGVRKIAGNPLVKHAYERRIGILRCATMEDIEAEKSTIEKSVKEKMEKTIESVRSNFNSIRTGRANPSMLDRVEEKKREHGFMRLCNLFKTLDASVSTKEDHLTKDSVEYYGTPVSLKSIAQVSTPDASSLLVQPYDKSSLKAIEKAIVSSDLGMTPNNDGETIRLSLPQLTSERRKELSKVVAKQAEEGKVALRNIRRDAIKAYDKLEKEKKISEDNKKDLSSDLQKVIDEYMKKIDTIYKQKEKELLTV